MSKLFNNARVSIDSGILEAPLPFRTLFSGAESPDKPKEPKCDYDVL